MASAAPTVVASSEQSVVYTQVFRDLNASIEASSYIGLYTLETYNTSECAAYCDNTALCTSFNLYIERDPSVNPSANDSTAATVWGYWCPNPASITNFKCTLWGSSIDASEADNYGEYREEFHTVITGSNGYDKTNVTVPTCTISSSSSSSSSTSSVATGGSSSSGSSGSSSGSSWSDSSSSSWSGSSSSSWSDSSSSSKGSSSSGSKGVSSGSSSSSASWSTGSSCGKKAINAPKYWMGSKFIPGPFNAQVCADYAWEQNLANKAEAVKKGLHSFTPCKMFNSYYLHKNGAPHGTYCTLYDTALESSWATYEGGWSGEDHFTCEQSWTFSLEVDVSFSTC